MFLQAGGKPQHFRLLLPAKGDDGRHGGRGIGQGAGLVKDNGIRFGHGLQESATLDGNVVSGTFPHGRQYGNGNGQL